VQGYNAQAAVEPTLLLIVGQSVTEEANDKQQLKPMVELHCCPAKIFLERRSHCILAA
jgi:hypothetical protein